jgi:hypothetical protein
MGLSIYFKSVLPVDQERADAINKAARAASEGRTWSSCEPVHFFPRKADGILWGGVKPQLMPAPKDAESEGNFPDGTFADVLEILSRLSKNHNVDWEISYDGGDGPVGYILGGACDAAVTSLVKQLVELSKAIKNSGLFPG